MEGGNPVLKSSCCHQGFSNEFVICLIGISKSMGSWLIPNGTDDYIYPSMQKAIKMCCRGIIEIYDNAKIYSIILIHMLDLPHIFSKIFWIGTRGHFTWYTTYYRNVTSSLFILLDLLPAMWYIRIEHRKNDNPILAAIGSSMSIIY